MDAQTHLIERIKSPAPKKILSLDGGGIRGVITIEILAFIEQLLRTHYQNERLVLADYFDFIAGTSTGAIIGAGLSMGMEVKDVRYFYLHHGRDMFDRANWLTRLTSLFGYKYNDLKLGQKLQEAFGFETTLGSDKLKTLLMIVMHNARTDSPWPVTNNPFAKYNDRSRVGDASNLNLPLWQLVKASAAAPSYFPPEKIHIGQQEFIFIDGCITPYNNPAFQAYVTATLNAYRINWQSGEEQLLIVSIGTGNHALSHPKLDVRDMHLLHHAASMPSHLMNAAQYQQDMLCRVFGECRAGPRLDSELKTLTGSLGQGCTPEKLFTYVRYDFDISEEGFRDFGLSDYSPDDVKRLDAVEKMEILQAVGKHIAKLEVQAEHFAGFW